MNDENLTPVKPGQILNPKGKPKGTRNRSTIIREWLEADATDGMGGNQADQLVRAQILKAGIGDTPAFHALFDGAFGKVTDKVETEAKVTLTNDVTAKILSKIPTEELEGLLEPATDNQ